jgi:hypothetical protein
MRRLTITLIALVLGLVAVGAPAAADTPERVEEPFVFVFPDFEHGVWVFSNIDRDFACTGGAAGFLGLGSIQRVETDDAVVLRVQALDSPTWLHPIVGEPGPTFNPCDNSAPEPAFVGTVDARANDNDGPNLGARANAFGDRARGVVYDTDGMPYQYGWTFKAVVPPDANDGDDFVFDPSWIRVDKYFLHPIGADG